MKRKVKWSGLSSALFLLDCLAFAWSTAWGWAYCAERCANFCAIIRTSRKSPSRRTTRVARERRWWSCGSELATGHGAGCAGSASRFEEHAACADHNPVRRDDQDGIARDLGGGAGDVGVFVL